MSYLRILRMARLHKQVTDRYVVRTEQGADLGIVKWYSPWRKYAFFPDSRGVLFEEACLHEIAQFLTVKTEDHKNQYRKR